MIIIMTEVQNFVTIIQSISVISMSKSGKTAKQQNVPLEMAS